ncbi:MAG: TPM domain-containing protein [bacterium]|nr:TPM domain-containing protein [bacterium]
MVSMRPRRILRHLAAGPFLTRRTFPPAVLDAIRDAVARAERGTTGEIRVAIEVALPTRELLREPSPCERALDVFGRLRVWDTDERNGVLLYVLLADHDVEIVADRGLAGVTPAEWATICHDLTRAFAARRFEAGTCAAVAAIGALLRREFPSADGGRDQLPDRPTLL